MKSTSRARIVATLSAILSAAVGAGVTALAGCTGSGESTGSIQLPVGSGMWDLWWCPDCSKVKATQDGPPSPNAEPLGEIEALPSP